MNYSNMINDNPMSPYGMALRDYFNGRHDAFIKFWRDDGVVADVPVGLFFRSETEFSTIENIALGLCERKVLDIGAGSGIHSLHLQGIGLDVWALDVEPESVNILRKRGIKNVIASDIFKYTQKGFDTLLLLSHGIGMTGTMENFRQFLRQAYEMTNREGIILLNSLDVRCTEDPANLSYHEMNKKNSRYIGEIRMQLEYNGSRGAFFNWLHVIPETLIIESGNSGWICEIVHREPSGDYLARLAKK